jgi:hypothetical protein
MSGSPLHTSRKRPRFSRQILFAAVCRGERYDFATAANPRHRRCNQLSVRRPRWTSEEDWRQTVWILFNNEVALTTSVQISDHECALAGVWIVSTHEHELFAVGGEADWSVNLLQDFNGGTAEYRDAIESSASRFCLSA